MPIASCVDFWLHSGILFPAPRQQAKPECRVYPLGFSPAPSPENGVTPVFLKLIFFVSEVGTIVPAHRVATRTRWDDICI